MHTGPVPHVLVVTAGDREIAVLLVLLPGDRPPLDVNIGDLLHLLHRRDLVPVLRGVRTAPGHHGHRDLLVDDRHALGIDVVVGVVDLLLGLAVASAPVTGSSCGSGCASSRRRKDSASSKRLLCYRLLLCSSPSAVAAALHASTGPRPPRHPCSLLTATSFTHAVHGLPAVLPCTPVNR